MNNVFLPKIWGYSDTSSVHSQLARHVCLLVTSSRGFLYMRFYSIHLLIIYHFSIHFIQCHTSTHASSPHSGGYVFNMSLWNRVPLHHALLSQHYSWDYQKYLNTAKLSSITNQKVNGIPVYLWPEDYIQYWYSFHCASWLSFFI